MGRRGERIVADDLDVVGAEAAGGETFGFEGHAGAGGEGGVILFLEWLGFGVWVWRFLRVASRWCFHLSGLCKTGCESCDPDAVVRLRRKRESHTSDAFAWKIYCSRVSSGMMTPEPRRPLNESTVPSIITGILAFLNWGMFFRCWLDRALFSCRMVESSTRQRFPVFLDLFDSMF